MRTTLTLDDDVAAALERLRRSQRLSLKQLVNEALRRGLDDIGKRRKRRETVQTRAVTLRRMRVASIGNIARRSPSSKARTSSDAGRCQQPQYDDLATIVAHALAWEK